MLGYYQHWEQKGKTWKAILDRIQQTINDQASNTGAEVTRERWDTPEITLQWYAADDIGRAIQVLIVDTNPPGDYELRISASAWKDCESPPVRVWKTQENIEMIPVPTEPQQLDLYQLKSSLCKVYDTVCKWTESNLGNKVDLLPLPPNLTGKFVKGRYVP